jgi:hypothetical protein
MDNLVFQLLCEMNLQNDEVLKNLEKTGRKLARNVPSDMIYLPTKNKKIYSQDGEDGITEAIFDAIGMTNKFYLEFGATEGYNNSEILHKNYGFSGVLWNGSEIDCPYTKVHQEFITVENIKELCAKYEVPAEPDFVSIDIDGNDWHVWRELNKVCRPRVLVIEHTGQFPPGHDSVMPYKADHIWDDTSYCGASLTAMYLLGKHLGYSLVCVDNVGVNLFFVRDDLEPEKKFFGANNVYMLYRVPKYGFPWRIGHPEADEYLAWDSAEKLLDSN